MTDSVSKFLGDVLPRHLDDPVEIAAFTKAMSLAASGVTVVSSDGIAGRFGLTVSAVTSVSADPPLVLACVNRRSPLVGAITDNQAFCINLLAMHQTHIADTFAGRAGKTPAYDFACTRWRAEITGSPIIEESTAWFDCALETTHDAGTHRIFIGRVVAAGAHGDAPEPLVYSRRSYHRLAMGAQNKEEI